MIHDHYEALGVRPDAGQARIRAAYLEFMRANHPDRRPGDPQAAERARRANAAWYILGDRSRRAAYDRARQRAETERPRSVSARADGASLREAAAAQRAYAATGERFRRAFHLATLKVAAAILCVGLVLLLVLGGP